MIAPANAKTKIATTAPSIPFTGSDAALFDVVADAVTVTVAGRDVTVDATVGAAVPDGSDESESVVVLALPLSLAAVVLVPPTTFERVGVAVACPITVTPSAAPV